MADTRTLAESTRSPVDGTEAVRLATTGANWQATLAAIFAALSVGGVTGAQGRLTLVSATPVMTSTQSAKTTVYYTPYTGQYVPLYNGTTMMMTDIGGELSQLTTDTTKSPAAVGASSNYDVFIWNDAGTFRATRGPAWTSATARGTGAGTTELISVKGIQLNANAITNGPAAQRGTYVGTIRSNASSQIDWIFGASAAGGTAAVFNVWNMYNRVPVATMVQDSTASWTYSSATWRSSDNSATMRVSYVCGLAEDEIYAKFRGDPTSANGSFATNAFGLDSTSSPSGSWASTLQTTGSTDAAYAGLAILGSHFIQLLEANAGSSPTTACTYRGATALASATNTIAACASGFSFSLRM